MESKEKEILKQLRIYYLQELHKKELKNEKMPKEAVDMYNIMEGNVKIKKVKWTRFMSRIHLGMKRPIRQFERNYRDLIDLIDEIEERPPTNDKEKQDYIDRLKLKFNYALIQLNNIKNTQIDYLESQV